MEKDKKKKLGLALGSGGARGFCHIGVLKAFEEHGIHADYMTGCSMGAMVGACYCCGVTPKEMEGIASNISTLKLMDINLSLKKHGFIKGERAMKIVRGLIGTKTFEDCSVPFKVTASNVITSELEILDEGVLVDAVRASISMPVAFHAVEYGDKILCDGGVLERIPIPELKDMGADVIIAVDALGPICKKYVPESGWLTMVERAYLMLDWIGSESKLKQADLVITPDQGNHHIYDFNNNHKSVRAGYKAALTAIPKIKELLNA